jgi:hypothetical protein
MEGHSPDETKLLISWGVQTGGFPLSPCHQVLHERDWSARISEIDFRSSLHARGLETIQADYARMQSTCQICTSAATNVSNWHGHRGTPLLVRGRELLVTHLQTASWSRRAPIYCVRLVSKTTRVKRCYMEATPRRVIQQKIEQHRETPSKGYEIRLSKIATYLPSPGVSCDIS